MKITLSVPDDLVELAEVLCKRLGVSRNRVYAAALADYVANHQSRSITAQLNTVYAAEESRLATPLRRAQGRSLPSDKW